MFVYDILYDRPSKDDFTNNREIFSKFMMALVPLGMIYAYIRFVLYLVFLAEAQFT